MDIKSSKQILYKQSHVLLDDFVYLDECDPRILIDLKYASCDNFVGRKIDGYKKNRAIIRLEVALALKQLQDELLKKDFSLLIFDAYRPQRASKMFHRWSMDSEDQMRKDIYYPNIDKNNLFKEGYISLTSQHSLGIAADLTICKKNSANNCFEPL
ncbi:MAG: hypothetical protein K2X39_06450, partial [Silvanigrellaceae bacterium]|nr:hypothetical protein [Silvanigrellaceae bacterium]